MTLYSKIEEVSALPRNLNSGADGWGFTAWSHLLDDEAPHRKVLERFAAANPEAGLALPPYDRYEDYVEADAAWDGATVSVYYESILSYLWIWSPSRDAVTSFRAALLPLIS
jgi:hypothetical protein